MNDGIYQYSCLTHNFKICHMTYENSLEKIKVENDMLTRNCASFRWICPFDLFIQYFSLFITIHN